MRNAWLQEHEMFQNFYELVFFLGLSARQEARALGYSS